MSNGKKEGIKIKYKYKMYINPFKNLINLKSRKLIQENMIR